MTAEQLRNSILQEIYNPKDGWTYKDLKDVVADSCPISYGIVQQGNHVNGGIPVVRPVDLHTKYVRNINLKCTSSDISNSYKRTILNGNEILLCVRGTTGIVALATEELRGCNVNRGIVPLYFDDTVDRLFIYYQLQSPTIQDSIAENTMGSALRQINIKDLRMLKILLPPLAEQQRIVAKLEELLPIVEQYGKAQAELDELNAALPARLRQSILQQAIQGKLVPQNENEGTAEELLKLIEDEKQHLINEKKLKKQKDIEPVEDIPFDTPNNWRVVRLADLCGLMDGEKRHGQYVCLDAKFLRGRSKGDILDKGRYVAKGTNIILVDGENSGEIFNVPCDGYMGSTFNQLWISSVMYLPYVLNFIKYHKENLRNSKKGAAIPHLNKDIFYNLLIGIPPLAEQQRIVAKIEELFAEIDKLTK